MLNTQRMRLVKDNTKYFTIILIPLSVYFVFFLLPNILTFFYSFYEWDGISAEKTFVGLRNYGDVIFDDPLFAKALRNTLYYAFILIILGTLIGLLLALALEKGTKINSIFRSIFFAPGVLCPIAVGLMWRIGVYDPTIGLLNSILRFVGLNDLTTTWLADQSTAMTAVVAVHVWSFIGFSMIMYISGLNCIPDSIFESASIEGASSIQTLFYISLPLLRNTTGIVTLLALINGFTSFDFVYVLTSGGSNGLTEVIATLLYKQMFAYHSAGRSSATAVLLLIIVLIISFIQKWALSEKTSNGVKCKNE